MASIEAVDTAQRVAQVRDEVAAAAAAAKHDVTVQLFTTEERGDILEARADIVSPCALGGGLNAESIPKISYVDRGGARSVPSPLARRVADRAMSRDGAGPTLSCAAQPTTN